MSADVSNRGIVIVGGGLAGGKAAQTLREEGYQGPLTILSAEAEPPYERPPLSKDYLQGSSPREKLLVRPAGWYAEQHVDLRLGMPASAIDRAGREVVLADGARIPYDRLLLATGSRPRRLDVPGTLLDGVHYLRTVGDSDSLRAALATPGPVVIVGGGWIGLEVAAAAVSAGHEVTVVEAGALPLLRVLGPEVAQLFARLHQGHGVAFRYRAQVARIVARRDLEVTGVELAGGEVLPATHVLVGVGIEPNVDLAAAAGLDLDNGIAVSASLRTSDPAIWAAGDVAAAEHPTIGRRLRVEHWANANRQGPVAARSMLGQDVVYDRVPYFYTDQYDLGMEYWGYVAGDESAQTVLRGDPESGSYISFWLVGGRVAAAMQVNDWDAAGPLEALVSARRAVAPDRLADGAVPLADL